MKTRPVTMAAVLVVLLLAVAAVASGCGSTSSDDGVAALDDAAATTSEGEESAAPANDTEEDPEEAALEWAKCMREHGIDVPDPEIDENGRVRVMIQARRAAEGVQDEAFEKAREECGTPFGDAGPPPLTDEQREEMQETMLEFAACMREHGVDMPDPDFSGEGQRFRFGGQTGIDPDSSTFQKAQEACQEILEDAFPGGGPGLRVGGGTDGPSTDESGDS